MGISVAYWLRANMKGFQKIVLFNLLVLARGQTITDPIIPTGNGSLIGTSTSIPINTTSNIGTNQTYPSTAVTEAIQNNSSFTTLRTTTDSMITTGNDSLIEPTTSIPINATSDTPTSVTEATTEQGQETVCDGEIKCVVT